MRWAFVRKLLELPFLGCVNQLINYKCWILKVKARALPLGVVYYIVIPREGALNPKEMLVQFDEYLSARKLEFEAVVIGGSALALLGVVSRETQDCDVLDPNIPEAVLGAARAFSQVVSAQGDVLRKDWLNNGPEDLKRILPKGWKLRVVKIYSGKALCLHTLGRPDLLKSKLFAYCDRGQDFRDCIALTPSKEELHECLEWVALQDANPDWPKHVEARFTKLSEKLGYGS